MKNYLWTTLCCLLLLGCNNDDDNGNNQQEVNVFQGCCSDAPVFGDNVDVLDQSLGEIADISRIVTASGDGYNDYFGVENLELYDNRMVTIYKNDNTVVYESSNYGVGNNFFPQIINGNYNDIVAGTYKYKIVIENEQTFLKSGTFCLVDISGQPEDVSFSDCGECPLDPLLTCL